MNHTGWLIYNKQDAKENASYIEWFQEESRKQHIALKLIYRETMQIGIMDNKKTVRIQHKPVPLPDIAIVRTVDPLLNFQLEQLGVHVFNSAKIAAICNHKALTYSAVNELGIPMLDSMFIGRGQLSGEAPMPFPFVIKDAKGRGGKEVYLIENRNQWNLCTQDLSAEEYVIQKANVQLGKDIRVFVVGKEIAGAVLRKNDNDFRANFKLGGTAASYQLQAHEIKMIHKIIDHFPVGMVGIDFLLGYDGRLLFNEMEDVVGSRTLSATSNVNILEKYITFIASKLKM